MAVKTCKIQKNKRGTYVNIPKDIVDKMQIEKGETVIIRVIDTDTMEIKIIEE